MKKLLLFFFFWCSLILNAQSPVEFHLTPEGTFVTNDGKDFAVVEYEGKNAHQLYQMMAANVGSVFNDPSKVMSGVDDVSIKIRAFCDNLYTQKVLGIPHMWEGYYQLEFRIKDGKVRVSAPSIEYEIKCPSLKPSGNLTGTTSNFPFIVKKWFKNGEPKEKELKNIQNVEVQMNYPINAILGLVGSTSKIEEDW